VLALEDRQLLASFTVTNRLDDGSVGSLRWAVNEVNQTPGANTIDFDSIDLGANQTITLTSGPLVLSNTSGMQTITGPAAGVTISGGGHSGVFQVNGGVTATLSGLTIIDGRSSAYGGGVFNEGTATLINCTLSGNSAGEGGGVENKGGKAALYNCTLSGNYSATFGGGVDNNKGSTVTLTNCTITGNSVPFGGGGVFDWHSGTAYLTNCSINGNSASYGGGVYSNGTAYLTNCSISGNSAHALGGGFNQASFGTATLTNCAISDNSARGDGGGLAILGTATLTNCSITENSAQSGGGVFNWGVTEGAQSWPAMATLIDCTVTGNSASTYGGGVYSVGAATATLTNCTIAGNTAGTSGGGIEAQATVTVTSSTFTGNRATYGGAIDNDKGLYRVTVQDSILAGDSAGLVGPEFCNSVTSAGHNLVAETDGSSGWVVGSDLTGTLAHPRNALLAPLGFYGGPTQTIALLPGSPAVGAGVTADYPGTSTPITTDERGFPLDSPIDIGAFQFHSSYSLVVKTTSDSGAPDGEFNLRGAIDMANILNGAQTITFDPTVFATAQTIRLTAGPLDVSDPGGTQTITGPAAGVTISGGGTSGVFQIFGGTAHLSGLTITDGNSNGAGAVYNDSGGGVYNIGTVTLTNCTLSGDSAGLGGGMENFGMATLTDCTVSGNSTTTTGGGVRNDGTAKLTNCTITGNSSNVGAGVYNYGMAMLIDCTISGNRASDGGGGVYNYSSATATLTDTIVAGNTGPSSAASDIAGTVTGSHNLIGTGGSGGLKSGQNGNIVMTSLTGLGLAPLGNYGGPTQTMALLPGSAAIGKGIAVSGVATDQRGFSLDSPIDIGAFQFHSSNSLVVKTTGDSGSPAGEFDLRGAVDLADILTGTQTITFDPTVFAKAQTILLTAGPLELSQTSGLETITGPPAGVTISGGATSGVFVVAAGVTASLSGLTVTDGTSTFGGGVDNNGTAVLTNCTITGNSAEFGGGVDNSISSAMTLADCTISGNSGGGVDDSLFSTATLTDCTISGNSGFGLANYGMATLTNCTISGNSAGGGLHNDGMATLTDTIVAGNTGPASAGSDITGTDTVTGSHNLIGTGGSGGLTNGQDGNIVLTSLTGLGLAPLGDYGGPTQTMALLPGSAAIGKGIAVSSVATDQRGFALDSPIDIGAFQFHSSYSLVVKTTSDSGAPAGEFDLRGAVDLADVLTGAQTITFDPTVFARAQTILLTAGPLELSQTSGLETITGPAARVTIRGGGDSGLFQVNHGVTAKLSGLTITDGFSAFGGGINNEGIVTLTNCTISGNSATSSGGGLFNVGTATLTDCTISGNSAQSGGGGVNNGGTAYLTNCTISQNSAPDAGGVENTSTAYITNCTISGNSAQNDGGGMETLGTATLTDCTLKGNTALFGGGLYDGFGTTKLTGCTVSSNTAFTGGGMFNTADGSIIVDGGTISANTASGNTGSGGGIFNDGSLSVSDGQIDANHSTVFFGGGLENFNGMAILTGCTFSGNTATDGGGASNFGGSLTANGCTFIGNSASYGGAVFTNSTAMLTNCTIAGNTAGTSGGGIEAQGTVTVTFCTFAGNQAAYGGAIDNYKNGFMVTVADSILAGDSASLLGPEFCNSVISAGHNLVAETDNSTGWKVGSDLTGTSAKPLYALLSVLGHYGGLTETMALLPGSQAIDAGVIADYPGTTTPITTDERGVKRPSTGVDIGAFQSQGFTLTPVSGSTPQSALIDTAFANALAVKVTARASVEPVVGGVIAFAAPSSGATATLSAATATIGSSGVASVNATANGTAGTYQVTALAAGAAAPASFSLTNTAAAAAAFAVIHGTSSSVLGHSPITGGTPAATGNDAIATFQPGPLAVSRAAQALPADADGKTSGPTLAGTGTAFSAQGLVDGQPVPRVIVSGAGWRSRRPWPAGAMRPRPARQSTRASVATRSLISTSP
jgi:hypothetical protein